MTIFDELAPVALELIDDLELDVVVQEQTATDNPTAGTSSITTTNRAARAAMRDFKETYEESVAGGSIASRRRVTTGTVIVPASYLPNGAQVGWSVWLASVVTDATIEYKVTSAERLPKIGTPVVWRLEVRK
jgi:hypothetical protein